MDRRAFLALSVLLGGCAATRIPPSINRAAPPLWGPLTYGPYDPGLDVAWTGNRGRSVQVWRWYPANAGSGDPMTVADLGRQYVWGGEGDWPTDPLAVTATGYDEPGQDNRAARLATLPVASRLLADSDFGPRVTFGDPRTLPRPKKAPLVVLGQGIGYESPFWQHDLAEYLASWGYEVRTTPLTGPQGAKAEVTPETLSAQVDDLAFLTGFPRRGKRLALLGFDLGGMASVALAGSDRVKPAVVIGIDSGVIGEALLRDLIESRADFDWARLTMPYVHFTRSAAENVARGLPEDLTIFERGNGAPRFMVRVPGMRHADFGAVGAIENVFPAFYGPVQGNPALGRANAIHLVRQALDHWTRRGGEWRPVVRGPVTIETWP